MNHALGMIAGVMLFMQAASAGDFSFKVGLARPNFETYGSYDVEQARHLGVTLHDAFSISRYATVEADLGAWSRPVGEQGVFSALPYPIDYPWRGVYEAIRIVSSKPFVTLTKNGLLNLDGGVGIAFHQAWPYAPSNGRDFWKAVTHLRGQVLLRTNYGPVYLAGEWQPPITNRSSVDMLVSLGYRFWAL